jgi:hypothetical protein
MKLNICALSVFGVAVAAIAGTVVMPAAFAAGVSRAGAAERELREEKERGLMMDILLCEQRERELKAQKAELGRQFRMIRCPVSRPSVAAKADVEAVPVKKEKTPMARFSGGVPAKSRLKNNAAVKKAGCKADLSCREMEKRYEKLLSEVVALKERRIHDRLVAHKQLDIVRAQAYECQRSLSECGRMRADALEKLKDMVVRQSELQPKEIFADEPMVKFSKGIGDVSGAALADILLARQRTLLTDGRKLERDLTAQKECLERLSSRIRQVQNR